MKYNKKYTRRMRNKTCKGYKRKNLYKKRVKRTLKKGGLDVFRPLAAAAVIGATSTQGRRLPFTSIRPNTGSSLSTPNYVNLTKSNRGPPKGPVGTFTKFVDFNDPKKPDNNFDEEKNFRELTKEMSPYSDPLHKFTDVEDMQSNYDELQRKIK
jgi:hypothetical protein